MSEEFADPLDSWCWALKTHGGDVCFELPVAIIGFSEGLFWRDMPVCAAHFEYAYGRNWYMGRRAKFKLQGASHGWNGQAWVAFSDPSFNLELTRRLQMQAGTVRLPACEHGCRAEVERRFGPLAATPDPAAAAFFAQRRAAYRSARGPWWSRLFGR